jgi:hypothetical protein
MMMMSVEHSVDRERERETEVPGENLPEYDLTRARTMAAAVEYGRLTAWAMALPLSM